MIWLIFTNRSMTVLWLKELSKATKIMVATISQKEYKQLDEIQFINNMIVKLMLICCLLLKIINKNQVC